MELRHLRYFVAVAEALSFSRAAEKLRVAQPALSRQVRNLEQELGVQLLERSHVRVQLTDAGRVFREHATHVLAQVDIAATAAQEAARGREGQLVVANDWRIPFDLLSTAIVAFRRRYPRVEITLAELRLHEQLPALRAGRIHLGFLPREFIAVRDDLELLPVLRSELIAVVAADHPLARRDSVRLRELARESWIWSAESRAQSIRAFTAQTCRLAGFTPSFGRTAETLEGMLTLVELGYGVMLLPRLMAPAGDSKVRLLPTDCDIVELCAFWRRNDPSQVLQHFIAILRERLDAADEVAPAPGKAEA